MLSGQGSERRPDDTARWEEVAEDYNRIFRRDAYYYDILT